MKPAGQIRQRKDEMTITRNWLGATLVATTLMALTTPANAIDRIKVEVVNERPFILSLELRDQRCGGNVILSEQLDAGEIREIEICASADGRGALGATYGSGCSQVKRMEIRDIAAGDALTF